MSGIFTLKWTRVLAAGIIFTLIGIGAMIREAGVKAHNDQFGLHFFEDIKVDEIEDGILVSGEITRVVGKFRLWSGSGECYFVAVPSTLNGDTVYIGIDTQMRFNLSPDDIDKMITRWVEKHRSIDDYGKTLTFMSGRVRALDFGDYTTACEDLEKTGEKGELLRFVIEQTDEIPDRQYSYFSIAAFILGFGVICLVVFAVHKLIEKRSSSSYY